jgi:hypothetical protein
MNSPASGIAGARLGMKVVPTAALNMAGAVKKLATFIL